MALAGDMCVVLVNQLFEKLSWIWPLLSRRQKMTLNNHNVIVIPLILIVSRFWFGLSASFWLCIIYFINLFFVNAFLILCTLNIAIWFDVRFAIQHNDDDDFFSSSFFFGVVLCYCFLRSIYVTFPSCL